MGWRERSGALGIGVLGRSFMEGASVGAGAAGWPQGSAVPVRSPQAPSCLFLYTFHPRWDEKAKLGGPGSLGPDVVCVLWDHTHGAKT